MKIHIPLMAFVASVLMLSAAGAARADEPAPAAPGPWKFGELLSLNLSQSAFSDNWSGGDKGSVVWVAGSVSGAERQFSPGFNCTNALTLAYGQTARQGADPANPGRNVWDSPDKTTDQILFESTGRFTMHSVVDPYVALRAESQFQDQSDPGGTLNFNPVKIKESAGLARVLVKTPDREAITRVGFGLRETFGRALLTTSPRSIARFHSNDGGFEWQTNVKQPVLDRKVLYTATLLVYQPVFYSKSSALDQFDRDAQAAVPGREAVSAFWRVTNVSFQNTFAAQVTKSISVNLFAQFVYDKFDVAANVDNTQPIAARIAEVDRNVRKAGQFKETLALGFTYRLF